MTDYTKTYDGAAKDTAQSAVTGADFDTEFSSIETAIGTKANKKVPATVGNLAGLDASGDLKDTAMEVAGNQITADLLGNVTGNVTGDVTGDITGSCIGNASTATALATGRTFSLTGDATGTSAAFDGTANASIAVSIAAATIKFSSEMSTSGAFSTNSISANSSEILSKGVWAVGLTSGTNVFVEVQIASGTWKRLSPSLDATNAQLAISDGTNVRVNNGNASAVTVYQCKLFN